MTLADFKSNPKLMKAAADLRIHATHQQVVEVLDTELRRSMAVSPLRLESDDKSFRLGEITGYNTCLQILRTIADPLPTPQKQLESTFGAHQLNKQKL